MIDLFLAGSIGLSVLGLVYDEWVSDFDFIAWFRANLEYRPVGSEGLGIILILLLYFILYPNQDHLHIFIQTYPPKYPAFRMQK